MYLSKGKVSCRDDEHEANKVEEIRSDPANFTWCQQHYLDF